MSLILLLLQDWELYPVWGGGAGNVPNSAAAAGSGAVLCLGWRGWMWRRSSETVATIWMYCFFMGSGTSYQSQVVHMG
jgi:hypothetical protein